MYGIYLRVYHFNWYSHYGYLHFVTGIKQLVCLASTKNVLSIESRLRVLIISHLYWCATMAPNSGGDEIVKQ